MDQIPFWNWKLAKFCNTSKNGYGRWFESRTGQLNRSTQQKILRERPKKKFKKSMNKDVWIYFKHFRRLLGNIYLFLTASKTDEEVPSQQGAPSTCNLTHSLGSFPADVGHRAQQPAPQTPTIFQFPRTYYFVQISQPAKICLKNRYFEEHIHWVPLIIVSRCLKMKMLKQTAVLEQVNWKWLLQEQIKRLYCCIEEAIAGKENLKVLGSQLRKN